MPIFEKQLRETETAIDNIITAIMGGISSKALQTKLAQLEAAKEEILIRIDEEKLEKPKISAEFMTFWLHKFRKLDVTKEAHRQMLVDTFVNAVFLHDDKLLLTFNFKDGTRTITFSDVQAATSENGSDLDCLAAPYRVFITDLTVLGTRFSFSAILLAEMEFVCTNSLLVTVSDSNAPCTLSTINLRLSEKLLFGCVIATSINL